MQESASGPDTPGVWEKEPSTYERDGGLRLSGGFDPDKPKEIVGGVSYPIHGFQLFLNNANREN